MFWLFESRGSAGTDFYSLHENCPTNVTTKQCVLTFQIRRKRKYHFLHLQWNKLDTPADPPDLADPPETRHEAWCTTPGTLAPEVRMTVVLNKLPQMSSYRAIWNPFRQIFTIFRYIILQTGKNCWHLGQAHDRFTKDSPQIRHRFTLDTW